MTRVYNIIVNPTAHDYKKQHVDYLIDRIKKAQCAYFIAEPDSVKTATYHLRNILGKRPYGIIACGGDSTVNLVARHLIRRRSSLGILPLGRFNNIYRSLYGEPDIKSAVDHILSRKNKIIDGAMASGRFFLGSIGFGFVPEMYEILSHKRTPKFSVSWSRAASAASSLVVPAPLTIKIDAFQFECAPLILNINLLPHVVGLPLVPEAIPDDGKCEVIFDMGEAKAILSRYVRRIFKNRYLYSDEIRMFRGNRITIFPARGRKMYIDGEIVECREDIISVDILEKRIRILTKSEGVST